MSSFELHLYDFPLLHETLERELPEHKRNALLLAMPNVSMEIINKKKKAFQAQIKYVAFLSAFGAAAPVPGLSATVDAALLTSEVTQYVVGFGLDKPSLQALSDTTNVPLNELIALIVSPVAARKITADLILKLIGKSATTVLLMAAEEGSRFIPLFGIPAAMVLSFTTTYNVLNMFLNMLAEDAQRVFKRALGLSTSV